MAEDPDTRDTTPAPDPGQAGAGESAGGAAGGAAAPGDTEASPRRSLFRRRRPAVVITDGPPEQATGAIPAPPSTDQPTGVIDAPAPPAPPRPPGTARLRRTRRELMREREDLLFHLGGLAFELHRRGMLAEEVARRRAVLIAEIDETVRGIDAQLDEIQADRAARRGRAVTVVEAAPAEVGCCVVCRAGFYAGARFCMQCGSSLAPKPPEAAAHGHTQVLQTAGES